MPKSEIKVDDGLNIRVITGRTNHVLDVVISAATFGSLSKIVLSYYDKDRLEFSSKQDLHTIYQLAASSLLEKFYKTWLKPDRKGFVVEII